MRLIKSSFEIIEQQAGLEGIYKQIELAGRTCYKIEIYTFIQMLETFEDFYLKLLGRYEKSKTNFLMRKVCLTNDEEKIIDFVKKAQNTSGGDGDEFYELVIKKIVEETNWREEAKKAAEKGIKFDTLTITLASWYKELSKMTNGIFKSSGKTSQLVEAAAMSRGGKMAKEMYRATMDSVMMGSDEEMKFSIFKRSCILK